jgi:spoIIIJ-associated protein
VDEIRLEIEGPDAGRIIGKRGNVLEAIQYLTTRVVHKPGEGRRHVQVDAEGYRARHEDQLAEMAERLGERVAKEGKVITFDPMSARDRRIVHMALREFEGVRTESNGEGPDRRVQIIPLKPGETKPAKPED